LTAEVIGYILGELSELLGEAGFAVEALFASSGGPCSILILGATRSSRGAPTWNSSFDAFW